MLEAIITYLQQKLAVVFPEFDIKCLCELVRDEDGNGYPAEYIGAGEYRPIDLDSARGIIYFRRNGEHISREADEEEATDSSGLESQTFPFRVLLYAPKDILKTDNAYIEHKLADNLRKALTVKDEKALRQSLKADSIFVRVIRTNPDRFSIAAEEVQGAMLKTDLSYVFLSLEAEAEVIGPPACFTYWTCNDAPATFNELCPAVPVANSDKSYTQTVMAGERLNLPDITVTQGDGSTIIRPAAIDIVTDQYPFVYSYPRTTGQTTSYAVGDDAYIRALYFSNIPAGRHNELLNFTTLLNNNVFGNKNRFTDIHGLQLWTDNYLIDNYTGLGWYITLQSASSWFAAISAALAASKTVNGIVYDDWFMPNLAQQVSLFNYELLAVVLSWGPMNTTSGLGTSTTTLNVGSTYNAKPDSGTASNGVKTVLLNYFICRKHF